MDTTKKPIYPIEPWSITETEFTTEYNYRNETAFALANGYIGTRGTFEEGCGFDIDTGLEGNFINGFYESEDIRYGEANFGSPLKSQSLLNLPNLKEIRICAEGQWFDISQSKIENYQRTLHMKEGFLERKADWILESGHRLRLTFERLVSLTCKNRMMERVSITFEEGDGTVLLVSGLDADVENHTRKTNPIVDYGPFGRRLLPVVLKAEEDRMYYEGKTKGSSLTMACGCSHSLRKGTEGRRVKEKGGRAEEYKAEISFEAVLSEKEPLVLEKYISYTSDLDMEKTALEAYTKQVLEEAAFIGWDGERKAQDEYMKVFWDMADVSIEGDDMLQQGIRFNLFHSMQAAGRDGKRGLGAKGLSGEGYEGHYFWDTEMYVLPVFIYTKPELAARLLDYRYDTLEQARERARVLGHPKGALFPWRTINGQEASTYYPLGTAQYHINADIAYALKLYLDVTGDFDYLKEKGAEILIETARVWADVGSFADCRGGKYCICNVTGPDEYNVLVDNNFYTNLMARENLRYALAAAEEMERKAPEAWEELKERLVLSPEELSLWKKIEENMYFPYDEDRKVYPMDDNFMMRKPWDESKIPPEKRAWLYENYHPLFVMRHRMSKQADAILGMYLLSHQFSEEELRRNYDFYQEVTLHHSSLSTCIFGILASKIGYYEQAYEYFVQSARMDLDDYHNNVYAGVHVANMAGTWLAIVNGFAGVSIVEGKLHVASYLPKEWTGYSFHICVQGRKLKIGVKEGQAFVALVSGAPLEFFFRGEKKRLDKEGEICYEGI